jgi:septum formation protein
MDALGSVQRSALLARLVASSGRDDGVCLLSSGFSRKSYEGIVTTTVEFAQLTDEEIAWYVASGEPSDKAGAYAIRGLASRFVTRIEGSYSKRGR